MRVGDSYKQTPIDEAYDAIVIGSGIGGLSAAALLARHARDRVLVLERHYTAGGFTHSFTRRGYEWDVGVHYIGDVLDPRAMPRRLFDHLSRGALCWADMGDVYDTIIVGGDRYQFVKGTARWRARMHDYFPHDREAIDRYLAMTRATSRRGALYFADKVLPPNLSRILSPLLRWPTMRWARKTTAEVLGQVTDNPRLRAVLTGQYGDYGLPPSQSSFFMHATVARHYLEGAAYPVGGSSQIAATIVPTIEATGGRVITNADVAEILVEGNRAVGVRLADGRAIRARLVLSDAGAANTVARLLPPEVAARHGLTHSLSRTRPSVAHVALYLGLKHTAAELGLPKTNLWIYPDDHHDENFSRFLADPEAPLPMAYISFPSAKDPDFLRRHPGRATIEILTLVPYEWFAPWESSRWHKRPHAYEDLKRRFTGRLLEILFSELPQLRGRIDHCELSTPLSTRFFTGHMHGEIYGLASTPERFEERWLRPRTPVQGLYLTGADVCAGGVVGAMVGGALCASAVLGTNLLAAVLKGATDRQGPTSAKAA